MNEENTSPIILITNDDGITAPGIRNLVEAVKGLGEIIVVAPDKPQSGIRRSQCAQILGRGGRGAARPELGNRGLPHP